MLVAKCRDRIAKSNKRVIQPEARAFVAESAFLFEFSS